MTRRDRKPKRRNPNAPTGYPTDADREHTVRVEAIAAQRLAESLERDRKAREREAERLAAMTPEQRAREEMGRGRARTLLALAAVMGGFAK